MVCSLGDGNILHLRYAPTLATTLHSESVNWKGSKVKWSETMVSRVRTFIRLHSHRHVRDKPRRVLFSHAFLFSHQKYLQCKYMTHTNGIVLRAEAETFVGRMNAKLALVGKIPKSYGDNVLIVHQCSRRQRCAKYTKHTYICTFGREIHLTRSAYAWPRLSARET